MKLSFLNILLLFQLILLYGSKIYAGFELSGRIYNKDTVPKWPNNTIYYDFSADLPEYHLWVIRDAIEYFNTLTCVKWLPVPYDPPAQYNTVVFLWYGCDTPGKRNCSSDYERRADGYQYITLGHFCLRPADIEEIIYKTIGNPRFKIPEPLIIPEGPLRNLSEFDLFWTRYELALNLPPLRLNSTPDFLKVGLVDDWRDEPKCTPDTFQKDGETHYRYGHWCYLWARYVYGKSVTLQHMLRTMGLRLEHQRPDRNCFIRVDENAEPKEDYEKLDENLYKNDEFPYDYYSILHYDRHVPQVGIHTTKPYGRYDGTLSEEDIRKVEHLFCEKNSTCKGDNYRKFWIPCTKMWHIKYILDKCSTW